MVISICVMRCQLVAPLDSGESSGTNSSYLCTDKTSATHKQLSHDLTFIIRALGKIGRILNDFQSVYQLLTVVYLYFYDELCIEPRIISVLI